MGYSIIENIQECLDRLRQEIYKDHYELTQDDQDAISLKIEKLRKFIEDKYEKRRSFEE